MFYVSKHVSLIKICKFLMHYHGDSWISHDVIEYSMAVTCHHGNIRVAVTNRGPGLIGNERGIPLCDIIGCHAPEIGIGMGHQAFLVDSNTVYLKMYHE